MSTQSATATPPVLSTFRAAYAAGKEMPRTGFALPPSWNDEARELFEERAALLEYGGGHTREEAEQQALTDVCLTLGVDGLPKAQPSKPAQLEDDGLTDLFGDVLPNGATDAIASGH